VVGHFGTADSGGRRNAILFEELSEFFGGGAVAEALAGPVVELGGDGVELGGGVQAEVAAFGEVFAEQAVDASMSNGKLVLDDFVLPGGLVGGHGPVDDVDQVALQDPACAAGAFGWLVAVQ
jgi:hypothetical protein